MPVRSVLCSFTVGARKSVGVEETASAVVQDFKLQCTITFKCEGYLPELNTEIQVRNIHPSTNHELDQFIKSCSTAGKRNKAKYYQYAL